MNNVISFSDRLTEVTPLELIEKIKQNIPKIEGRLVGNLTWYSPGARLVPDSIDITAVEYLSHSHYRMDYNFTWNVFNPCLDIDSTEVTHTSVNFVLRAEGVEFDFIDTEPGTVSEEL